MDIGTVTKDLEASVTGLPSTYDVFIGWNPNSNSDVGWLTLKKGVTRDFKHLQLRDFNLNNLENTNVLFEKEKAAGSSEGCSTVICPVEKVSCEPEDSKLLSVSNLKDQEEVVPTPVEMLTSHEKTDVEKPEMKKRENVPLRVGMGNGSASFACIYCNRNIKDKERHEAKCPSKNSKYTERVKCSICGYRVLRKGLTSHMKIHSYVTRNCSNCGIPVKEEGYNIHLLKCRERYRRHHEILCPVCRKSFGSLFSLSKHFQALHPNLPASHMEPVIKLKYSESVDVKKERSVEKFEHSLNKGNVLSEGVVSNGNGQEAISEHIFRGEMSEYEFSMNDFQPAWNEEDEAICRLKFEMEVGGIVYKKTIKTLMSNSVEKSMKKFSKHSSCSFDDLEFKSNDTVLSGEELAGSIDKGLIKVSLISFDDKEVDDLVVTKDITPTASNFEDLRKDYYEEMRSDWFKTPPLFHHSTPAPSDTCSNDQEVNEAFPVLDSVSVGVSEGATDTEDIIDNNGEVVCNTEGVSDTEDNMDSEVVGITEGATDTEDNMDMDGEAVGNTQGSSDTEDIIDIDGEMMVNTEHVVDFSMF